MIKVEIWFYLKILLFVIIEFTSIIGVNIYAQSFSKTSTQKLLSKSNQPLNDSLDLLTKNGKIKTLSFEQHMAVQKQYDKLDKKIRMYFTESFLNRKDLMAVNHQRAEALLLIGINLEKMGDDLAKAKKCYDESYEIFSKLKNDLLG